VCGVDVKNGEIKSEKSIVWRCFSHLDKHKDCDARTVNEDILKQAVLDAMNQVFGNENEIKTILLATLEKVLNQNSEDEVSAINKKLQALQTLLLATASNNQDVTEIGEQIIRLKEEKQRILLEQASIDNSKQRIEEMLEYLDNKFQIEKFDDVLVRRMVGEIKIFDEHITVKFKSGIDIEMRH
jgi:hypothetical protein